MLSVWKFKLEVTDLQQVEMPQGAQLMTVQEQGGELCLWAAVDTEAPKESRTIEIIGTGNPFHEASRRYVASVQQGVFVWHVFERTD